MIVKVDTEDIYADMKKNLDEYDTSNYSPGHPLFSDRTKRSSVNIKMSWVVSY